MEEKSEYYIEIKPRNTFSLNLKELIEYKELFYFFTWRDIKVKYKQTVLGFLWAILQPILLMAIFTVFIGRSFAIPTGDIKYPVFVFSGLILWLVFSSGLANAGNSMVSNAQMIKKIYFPRLIIPVSAILVAVFDFLMAFLVFIPILIFYKQPVDVPQALIWWPLGLLLTVIATFGPGCWLAALNVKYRDFRYVIPFLVQVLLFVTPVIYPLSILKNKWLEFLVALNPMYAAITIFRIPLSPTVPDPLLVTISIFSSLLLLLVGLGYFRRTEMYFADLS
ncbi:MAG: ABC transporter permease [Cytophagales bacterium]|nr:ABC transporter permease [Cytophagales bacterium]